MKKKNPLLWLLPLLILLMIQCRPEPADINPRITTTDDDEEIQYSKDDYSHELGTHEGLNEDTEWGIVQAYYKKLKNDGGHDDLTISDVWVEKYIGAYCPPYITPDLYEGWTWENRNTFHPDIDAWNAFYYAPENQTLLAVIMGANDQDNGTEQREVSIKYMRGSAFVRDGDRVFLWHDGELRTLAESYGFGRWLLFNWDFLRIANLQNGLDHQTQIRIEEDWGKSMPIPWKPKVYYELNIQYLGAYNGYIVIKTTNGIFGILFLEIDGVRFISTASGAEDSIFAWKEGQIYTLQELYEQELITRDDLITIAYNVRGVKEEE